MEERTRREFEILLGGAFVDVATEIRLTDPCELIALVRGDRGANLADLVTSSTELFFKVGTVRYARFATCRVNWQEAPEFELSMEFRHRGICAAFQLLIAQKKAGLVLLDIEFDDGADLAAKPSERLALALFDARLTRH